jgi:tocopherol O-methyltransferase
VPAIDAAGYYSDLTRQYERYAAGTHGWHYGIWESDVRSHPAALRRSNELLLRGLTVDANTRILDVGFGVGGFSVWAASTCGARVTGITVAAAHAGPARELAERHGVARRCDFLVADMDALAFRPETFDVVVNQETFCHAADKRSYLSSIRRVLRPGGVWRAVDFSVRETRDGLMTASERASYEAVCRGFHLPSMIPAADTVNLLDAAGFRDVETRDVSAEVQPTAALILKACLLPRLAAQLRVDRIFRAGGRQQLENRRGHVDAAYHYSRGLRRRLFRHVFYSARTA